MRLDSKRNCHAYDAVVDDVFRCSAGPKNGQHKQARSAALLFRCFAVQLLFMCILGGCHHCSAIQQAMIMALLLLKVS
jgi:hypothetical protein